MAGACAAPALETKMPRARLCRVRGGTPYTYYARTTTRIPYSMKLRWTTLHGSTTPYTCTAYTQFMRGGREARVSKVHVHLLLRPYLMPSPFYIYIDSSLCTIPYESCVRRPSWTRHTVIPLSLHSRRRGGVAAWAGFVAFAPPCTVACAAARYSLIYGATPPHCVAAAAASVHTPQSYVAMWPPGVTSVK